eukprot:COSAG05_NODE_311_length_11636_cov_11.922250_11_plen_78_part_00
MAGARSILLQQQQAQGSRSTHLFCVAIEQAELRRTPWCAAALMRLRRAVGMLIAVGLVVVGSVVVGYVVVPEVAALK